MKKKFQSLNYQLTKRLPYCELQFAIEQLEKNNIPYFIKDFNDGTGILYRENFSLTDGKFDVKLLKVAKKLRDKY